MNLMNHKGIIEAQAMSHIKVQVLRITKVKATIPIQAPVTNHTVAAWMNIAVQQLKKSSQTIPVSPLKLI